MGKPNQIAVSDLVESDGTPNHELILFDESNPRSVINMVPPRVREEMLRILAMFPHYFTETETELYDILKPTDLDDRLRVAFWHEYDRAQDRGVKMQMKNVFSLFCSDMTFYKRILISAARFAWIINRPSDYAMSLEASLNHGKNTLDKIIKMSVLGADGKIDKVAANIFLKAYELLDNRVKGGPLQRIEQKTKTMHIKTTDTNPDLVERELQELEAKYKVTSGTSEG